MSVDPIQNEPVPASGNVWLLADNPRAEAILAQSGGNPFYILELSRAAPVAAPPVAGDRFEARARTATARSKPRLWRLMASIWPEYDRYQTRTTREIPVVILERLG